MRPPSNRRQFAKWLATMISLALLVIWIAAGFRTLLYSTGHTQHPPGRDFALSDGLLLWFEPDARSSNGYDAYYAVSSSTRFSPGLIFRLTRLIPGLGRFTIIPLWLPFLLAAIPTALLWRRDRHRPTEGHCPNCNYNMTGNVSGKCSECGTPVGPRATLAQT